MTEGCTRTNCNGTFLLDAVLGPTELVYRCASCGHESVRIRMRPVRFRSLGEQSFGEEGEVEVVDGQLLTHVEYEWDQFVLYKSVKSGRLRARPQKEFIRYYKEMP